MQVIANGPHKHRKAAQMRENLYQIDSRNHRVGASGRR